MATCFATGAALLRVGLLATTAITLFAAGDVWARVGVTSAADGDPLGKPPNENERVLRIGIDVQAQELITTAANDRAHLVFLDGSSLTVGPNARLVIDKFVFDPNTKKGDLAINATKGVFRLVGGKISKSNAITVTTPSSTIGIRGGITIVSVTDLRTVADFVFGTSMTVIASGVTQIATRPGSQIVTNRGGAPGAPTLIKQGTLNAALGELEGGSSSSSSSSNNPDRSAQTSGFSGLNSGAPITPPTFNRNLPPNTSNNVLTNVVSNVTDENQPRDSTPTNPRTNPTPPPTPKVIVTQGRFLREQPYLESTFNRVTLTADRNPANNQALAPTGTLVGQVATISFQDGSSVQVPFVPGETVNFNGVTPFGLAKGVGTVTADSQFFTYLFADSSGRKFALFGGTPTAKANFPTSGFGVQQLANIASPGNLAFASDQVGGDRQLKAAANQGALYSAYGKDTGTALQVTMSVAGTGPNQKSYMGVFVADYADATGNSIYSSGNYAGSYRLGGNQEIGRLASSQATADTAQGSAIYGSNGQYMAYLPDRIVTTSGGTTRIPGAALDQPYDNLNGKSYYPVTVATPAGTPSSSSAVGQTRTTQTLNGYVGGLVDAKAGGQSLTLVPIAFLARPTDLSISTDAATNRAMATLTLQGPQGLGLTLQLGGTTGPRDASSAFIDDKIYAMLTQRLDPSRRSTYQAGEGTFNLENSTLLASANAAPIRIPGQSGACTCEYLSWGWWSTSIAATDGPLAGDLARVNLGTYVTGKLTTAVQMPQTGGATYNGFMVGNVQNGKNSYIGSGSYQMGWSFASRAGNFNGTFDGMKYSGVAGASAGSSGVTFSGAFSNRDQSRVGTLGGSFFSAPGDPAKYQGGSFSIGNQSTPYKASGIFAGQR